MTIFNFAPAEDYDGKKDETSTEVWRHVIKSISIDEDGIKFQCEDGAVFEHSSANQNEFIVSLEDKSYDQKHIEAEVLDGEGVVREFLTSILH